METCWPHQKGDWIHIVCLTLGCQTKQHHSISQNKMNVTFSSGSYCTVQMNVTFSSVSYCTVQMNVTFSSGSYCTVQMNVRFSSGSYCTVNMNVTSVLVLIVQYK